MSDVCARRVRPNKSQAGIGGLTPTQTWLPAVQPPRAERETGHGHEGLQQSREAELPVQGSKQDRLPPAAKAWGGGALAQVQRCEAAPPPRAPPTEAMQLRQGSPIKAGVGLASPCKNNQVKDKKTAKVPVSL